MLAFKGQTSGHQGQAIVQDGSNAIAHLVDNPASLPGEQREWATFEMDRSANVKFSVVAGRGVLYRFQAQVAWEDLPPDSAPADPDRETGTTGSRRDQPNQR